MPFHASWSFNERAFSRTHLRHSTEGVRGRGIHITQKSLHTSAKPLRENFTSFPYNLMFNNVPDDTQLAAVTCENNHKVNAAC